MTVLLFHTVDTAAYNSSMGIKSIIYGDELIVASTWHR